ncbi:MAG: hypothetical protein JO069_09975 [Verrucomicrobia bacterium]|nr:hypothetical protein [Verrucomicrobiota bacterium]
MPTPVPDPDWQTGCLLVVLLWLLFAVVRGWVNGPFRLLVKPLALLAAWLLAHAFGGSIAGVLARSTGWPAPLCTLIGICGAGFLGYQAGCFLGRAFFKRTRDVQEPWTRVIFGVTGAGLGLVYGLFLTWAVVVMIRFLGHFAAQQAAYDLAHDSAPGHLTMSIVRLQASLEAGVGKPFVNVYDPVPRRFYQRLEWAERLAIDPAALQRFVTYPGFEKVWDDPKVRAVASDRTVTRALERGDVWAVMTNPKIWDLLSSPGWWAIFSGPEFDAAARYALDGT